MTALHAVADADTTTIGATEAERLAAVQRYDILDTAPEGAFDRVTALAARLFEVPITVVSIVDRDRIWFKSHHGLAVTEIERQAGLCASAILQGEPWVVTDAAVDPRTVGNPLVAGALGLRFYLGAPLTTADGYNLGTLCDDTTPGAVSDKPTVAPVKRSEQPPAHLLARILVTFAQTRSHRVLAGGYHHCVGA